MLANIQRINIYSQEIRTMGIAFENYFKKKDSSNFASCLYDIVNGDSINYMREFVSGHLFIICLNYPKIEQYSYNFVCGKWQGAIRKCTHGTELKINYRHYKFKFCYSIVIN